MRLIDKLTAKRDAAHAEYLKWQGMVEVLQSDPDFASVAHHGATKVMQQAMAQHANGNGNGNGNGHAPSPEDIVLDARRKAALKGWTPERRAKYSARLKEYNPMHEASARRKKARRKNHLSPTQRKAVAQRMKKLHADPKFAAKRLKALRKALKAKMAARKAGTPWVAKNAAKIARQQEQAGA